MWCSFWTDLIERCQVELLSDEFFKMKNGSLGRAADPLPLESSELTAVTL